MKARLEALLWLGIRGGGRHRDAGPEQRAEILGRCHSGALLSPGPGSTSCRTTVTSKITMNSSTEAAEAAPTR